MSVLSESLWKDIPNFENYQAHPDGEIRNKTTKRIFTTECKKHRYISLNINGTSIAKHRLIALTFHNNPTNLEQVNHKDGNKRNNKASNLEWISPSDNIKDSIKRGKIKPIKNARQTCIKIEFKNGNINQFNSIAEASKTLSINRHCILYALKGDGGFYYGSKTGPKNKEDWLWKVKQIINGINTDIIEKNITIEGFTHLIACSDGRVLNKKNRNAVGSSDGRYLRVNKSKGSKTEQNTEPNSSSVHRLIAETFIPNPENKKVVNHIDGNTLNNAVTNLEWVTQSENMQHAISTGLINAETNKIKTDKLKVPVYQLELDGSIIKKWDGACDVSELTGMDGGQISTVCVSYKKNSKIPRNLHYGYGWCYVSDYKEPIINKSLSTLFPEITDFRNINFDILRPFVSRGSRPLWQIDIDGSRIKLWENMNEVVKIIPRTNISNLCMSFYHKKHLSGGYFWELASYEDIVNPTRHYVKIIPDIIKTALQIKDNVNIKPEIVTLLRENIFNDIFRIKIRPIVQLTLDNKIIKYWSGPTYASKQLGYGRNQIESCLYGKSNKSKGFKWRYMTIEEIIE
jgi:hypothetical protein